MADQYASGKFAFGICDYCGLRFKLTELRPTVERGRKTGFLACKEDWSPDHPQNRLAEVAAAQGSDQEALRNPRPENNQDRVLPANAPDWFDLLTKGSA